MNGRTRIKHAFVHPQDSKQEARVYQLFDCNTCYAKSGNPCRDLRDGEFRRSHIARRLSAGERYG